MIPFSAAASADTVADAVEKFPERSAITRPSTIE
jgi:hypothetical protein